MSHVTQKDYQDAIYSQSAVNASGLIKSLAEIIDRIWEDAREQGGGTDFVNRHPIVRLYVEQLAHLSGAGMFDQQTWESAYRECSKKSGIAL